MSTVSYEIRKAVPSDAEGIAHVHVKSWQTSYRGIIEQSFLDNISYEQRLKSRKEILKSKNTLQLVVTFEGKTVGFVNTGPLRPELYNERYAHLADESLRQATEFFGNKIEVRHEVVQALTCPEIPRGQPGRPNSRPLKGLSRVRGNSHARFLWGWGVVTPLGYQTYLDLNFSF